jgi:hypothetical protein
MYLSREATSASLTQIAHAFDRDHTTVLHAVRTVEGRLEPGSEAVAILHRARTTLGIRRVASPSTVPSEATHPQHLSTAESRLNRGELPLHPPSSTA